MPMTVLGCGYPGATQAARRAELGFDVMGLDVDAERCAVAPLLLVDARNSLDPTTWRSAGWAHRVSGRP